MVKRKHLFWALLLPFTLLALALLGLITYILLPSVLSVISGKPDICSPFIIVENQAEASVLEAMHNLCATSQAFLGIAIMLLIVLSAFSMLVPMGLTTIDIVQSESMETSHKLIWLVAMWLLFGLFAASAYYFLVKKKE
jgi:hypothetical protein